ncbi:MAG: DNA-processing protein DprA [Geminicoccaceae bacterium]|nr:DNA-processing protein DprA [Geminicoccaceae bacterium]
MSASGTEAWTREERDERRAWLRLARSPGIGPKSHARLRARFGGAREAVAALPRLLATGRWPGVELAPEDAVEAELEALAKVGGAILLADNPEYPPRLRALDDAPPVLAVRGRAELLAAPSVAIVGARNASHHGRLLAAQMARALSAAGITVVSGLARGIDTAAHEGALAGPGSTIAVLACGLDRAYPEENADLLERIARLGCVVSERPPGAPPRAEHFPRRNRIIAGLALGVVVVEAAPHSGSLVTARLALEAGREVMAVPGSPLDPRHRGTNRLLREGAHLVESAEDVLAVLAPLCARSPRAEPASAPETAPVAQERARAPAAAARGGASTASSELAERLLAGLGTEPVAIDDLVRECQVEAAVIQDVVLELELEGSIERHPGNRIARRLG